jgi:hypothetical protein
MLLAPLLLLVGFSIHSPEPHDGAQMLGVIANNAGRWNAAHMLLALSIVLAIPATLGLMNLLEHKGGARFALIGGSLAIIGVIFLTLFIGVELAMSAIASIPVEQHAGIEPAMQALIDFDGPLLVVFVGLSLNLGLLVLAVGLSSTRAVPRWTSVSIEVAALVLVGGLVNNPIGAVGAAVLLVGLGTIGLRMLKSVCAVNTSIVAPVAMPSASVLLATTRGYRCS